ncbi:MAG: phosphatase PAP2 family protein [Candidatus Altiarchaeota archaeon]
MQSSMFTRRELTWLGLLGLFGLAAYFSGLDFYVAESLAGRASHGISLFFSYQYFVIYILTSLIVLSIRHRRAAAALSLAIVLLFVMHLAITGFAPRARPIQALPEGDQLMRLIRWSGASSSFFSAHTASVVAVCAVFIILDFHPIAAVALGVPIILSRITLIQHYPSDILGGVIFGYVTMKVAYWAVRKKR